MMDQIMIDKYKEFWVLASTNKVEEGLYVDAPPVRIIPHADRGRLKAVLLELFAEGTPVIPRPDFDDPGRQPGIRAAALNLKKSRDYTKHLRVFNLQKTAEYLLIEEWQREKNSWVPYPLWKKQFPLNQFDELIEYLIEKTGDDRDLNQVTTRGQKTNKGRQT
jgi:hypothetical protein